MVEAWPLVVLGAALVAASVTDVRRGRIPNAVTYPAIAIGLIGHAWMYGLSGLGFSLAGLAAGFFPMLVCWLAGGIGGGDAKLAGAVGALAGWQFAVATMLLAFIVAAVMAVAVMVRRRIVGRTLGRIAHSVLMAVTPGSKRVEGKRGEESPKIPFGLALCVGAAVALADVLLAGPLMRAIMGV